MKRLCLDFAATTPVAPEVVSAMTPFLGAVWGNPSSMHAEGRYARQAVDEAREAIAEELGCAPTEIIFTSGATEANNLAIRGAISANNCRQLITTAGEHHSVQELAEVGSELEGGSLVTQIGEFGHADVAEIGAVASAGDLVSVIWGNNETGALNPIEEIGTRLRELGCIFHSDASQIPAWVKVCLRDLPIDLATFSSHKMHGPKGVGLLYVRKTIKMSPQILGGAQERRLRPGTENVAGIVGCAAALRYVSARREKESVRIRCIRNELCERILARVPDSYCHSAEPMLPNILNLSFKGVSTELLVTGLDIGGVAASSGSACASGAAERSHVIAALPIPEDQKESSLRLSLGYATTREEALEAAGRLEAVVNQIRNATSLVR